MPEGLVRSGDFRNGTPVTLPLNFGTPITEPHSFGNPVPPTDATFNAIAAKLTPAALIELQLSVGFYIMTSKFLETFGIDMQPVTEVV